MLQGKIIITILSFTSDLSSVFLKSHVCFSVNLCDWICKPSFVSMNRPWKIVSFNVSLSLLFCDQSFFFFAMKTRKLDPRFKPFHHCDIPKFVKGKHSSGYRSSLLIQSLLKKSCILFLRFPILIIVLDK